ncbi:MAG: endolytic transglycosylase MltG [Clostridia bacterium]
MFFGKSKKELTEREARILKAKRRRIYVAARPAIIVALSVVIALSGVAIFYNVMLNQYISPVDSSDATPITVVVESGWGASTIAKALYEACGEGNQGLIRNKAVFKVYVDFMGKAQDLLPGRYYLSKNMDIPSIIDTLCRGGEEMNIVRLTFPEGMTVKEIAAELKAKGMEISESEFLENCKTGANFANFDFISAMLPKEGTETSKESRKFNLEGYLFPDTYDFYLNASSDTIIRKMLSRFDLVFTDEYKVRAKEMNMSIDDILIIASMIEKEAVLEEDYAKVAAIFQKRLKTDTTLGSDAVLAYYWDVKKLNLTAEELQAVTQYNTRKNKGLPPSAICNPGQKTIYAALHPDMAFADQGYLYFCLKYAATGELVYAKTYEEHLKNIEMYKPYW